MIPSMSLRLVWLLGCFALACGGPTFEKGEPKNAKEKQALEAKRAGDDDDVKPKSGKKWNKWRYQGDRKDCFFVFGARCFKTEKAACQAAKCKKGATCTAKGAGPATVSCSGGA
jgi:hypothetical protein